MMMIAKHYDDCSDYSDMSDDLEDERVMLEEEDDYDNDNYVFVLYLQNEGLVVCHIVKKL
jgi:hypothetical protein